MTDRGHILALAGGVGGAKLANGLAAALAPEQLTIVVNTGDDFEHLGLHISPDIDSVIYALAGLNDPVRGWGLANESWNVMQAVSRLGGPDWFALGDQDLATHLLRTLQLRSQTLAQVTADLARGFGISHRIVPMSNDPVRSIIETDEGPLPFQQYFVHRRCEPKYRGIHFDGIKSAKPSPDFDAALEDDGLRAIVLCPSNPFLSIRPILALPGVSERIRSRGIPVIAVSPFINGRAVKGPAAKIFHELGIPATADGLLTCYEGIVTALAVDLIDAKHDAITSTTPIFSTSTLMQDVRDQARLAGDVLSFIDHLNGRTDFA